MTDRRPTQRLAYHRQHTALFLERRGRLFWLLVGLALIAGLGWLDFRTGYEYAFSFFYLAPISLTAWYAGRRLVIPCAILGGFVWVAANTLAGQPFSSSDVILWNTVIRTAVFLMVGLLTADLRRAIQRERELARVDGATGAINSRFFHHLLQMEIERSVNSPRTFSLAFVDLDNFKQVNDIYGHLAGDDLLQQVVEIAQRSLRRDDIIGRVGGDEFALLLPDTDYAGANRTFERIRQQIQETMEDQNKPVTMSMGGVTFERAPLSVQAAMQQADALMYAAKQSGKNRLITEVYPPMEGEDGGASM